MNNKQQFFKARKAGRWKFGGAEKSGFHFPALCGMGRAMEVLPIIAAAVMALSALAGESGAQTILYADSELPASCTNYNPALRECGAGTNTAYPTIAAAAAAAKPGATVFIRAGTYKEQLIPGKSGAPGNYITFKNYGSELVYFTSIGTDYPAIDISGCNYVIIDGLHVEDTNTFWLEADNANYNIVQNCVFEHTPATGTTGNVRFVQSDYNQVLNNVINDGNDNLTFIESDYNLAQGNTITQARHALFGIRCGNYDIIRSNYFSNTEQHIGEVYDCGADTHAVSNLYNATKHNVIEDNTFALTSTYYSVSGGMGLQYSGQQGIIRRNFFYDCNTGLGMAVYADEALYNTSNRVYNNDFYTNVGPGLAVWPGDTNDIFLNNILFGNRGCINDCTVTTPGQIVYKAAMTGADDFFKNNDLLFQTAGQAVMEEEFDAGFTIAQFTNLYPGVLLNSLEVNPQFVNATNFGFQLQSTSPMIDAGVFLTSAAAAGSGTNLAVLDAGYFLDGYGIAGVEGDVIQLQGQTQTALITRVDYTNNILTLNQPLNWAAAQGVSLQFSGQAPDIGAIEFVPIPTLIIRLIPNALVLSWPLSFYGYQIQSTTNLPASVNGVLQPIEWLIQTNAVAQSNQWVVTVPFSNTNRFFRLSN
jgi:hypothetical protein